MEMVLKNNEYRVVALSSLQDVNAWENGQKTDKVVNKTFDCAALSDSMKDLIKGTKDNKAFSVKLPADFNEKIDEMSVWEITDLHVKCYQLYKEPGCPVKMILEAKSAKRIQ